jgi:hypothetical protein
VKPHFKELLLGIALVAVTLNASAQSWVTNGLVAYYSFNGNADDESGFGKNGVVEGAMLTADRFGRPNSAYSFNGVNQRITTVGENGLPLGTNDFSMSIWASVDWPGSTSDFRFLVGNSDFSQFQWNLNTGTNKAMYFYTGGPNAPVPNGVTGEYLATPDLFWNNQQWYQLAITRAHNVVTMYRNGVPLGSKLFVTGNNAAVGLRNLTIGRRVEGSHPFLGRLDDLRVYNRALTADEVAQLYTIEAANPLCSPHAATATATLVNGFMVGAVITDLGCGYTNVPAVQISGGGGSGAAATAIVLNGAVTGLTITSAGAGYTNAPYIQIASPPFAATLSIAVSRVNVNQHVVVGRKYVLESSTDLIAWTATGPQFIAQSEYVTTEFVVSSPWQYFRIREVP